METLKKWMLFFYGTTPSAVAHHTEQAKMVAYTLGGIIAFITLPFILAGTLFLTSNQISSDVIDGPMRWLAIFGMASVLTFGIVWLERALVVLGDAVSQHIAPQIMLLVVRLSMIFLLSVVIAEKWELASHQGLIRAEKLEMRDEEIAKHQKKSDQEFSVVELSQQRTSTQTSIVDLQNRLAKLPENLTQALGQAAACQLEAKRLWLEYQNLRNVPDKTEVQMANVNTMRIRAGVKSTECKQLERSTQEEIQAYKKPLNEQLSGARSEVVKLNSERSTAVQNAKNSYTNRMQEADQARNDAGTDAKAFGRVRSKNPDIDRAVLTKTMLLAGIELLPLLLKLLLRNSPISAETRSVLQIESAKYREQTKISIAQESIGYGSLPIKRMPTKNWPPVITLLANRVVQRVSPKAAVVNKAISGQQQSTKP